MVDSSYKSTQHRTGGGPSTSTACIKPLIVRVVSAKFKAVLIQGQACRMKLTRRANVTVRFICEPFGCPLASSLFDIAAP